MPLSSRAVLGALLAIATVVVACGDDGGRDQAASGTATGTPARPDPSALAMQAADQIEATTSFHFLLQHENGGTPIVLNLEMTRAEGDLVKPDRLRADVEAVGKQLGNAHVQVKGGKIGSAH